MIKSCFILESKIIDKRVYPFFSRLTIGRQSTNDIALPDRTVSKRHAVVVRVKGQAVVKDLGSRNGTFVNGQRVEKAVLASGDRLKVGNFTLRFFREEESATQKLDGTSTSSRETNRLGEYLLEAGIVDEFTLLRALGEEEKSQTIDEILLDTGVIDDLNIAKALARQLKLPMIGLKELEIPQEVTSLVPVAIAKTHLLIPVKVSEGKLLVAMANPLDTHAIQLLRMVTRMKIEVAVAPREEILETFVRVYPVEFLNQMLDEAPSLDDVTVDL